MVQPADFNNFMNMLYQPLREILTDKIAPQVRLCCIVLRMLSCEILRLFVFIYAVH